MARNPYVKVSLFEPASSNLMGGTVVGQTSEWMLIQRPEAKQWAKSSAPKKPRAKKSIASGYTMVGVDVADGPETPRAKKVSQPATSFDPEKVNA